MDEMEERKWEMKGPWEVKYGNCKAAFTAPMGMRVSKSVRAFTTVYYVCCFVLRDSGGDGQTGVIWWIGHYDPVMIRDLISHGRAGAYEFIKRIEVPLTRFH